jgi:hypothetical protein
VKEVAGCLAGLGRVAMDLGATEQARQYLVRSIRLSQATGVRISIARGLEAFAALARLEDQPELAVQLTEAAAAVRERSMSSETAIALALETPSSRAPSSRAPRNPALTLAPPHRPDQPIHGS